MSDAEKKARVKKVMDFYRCEMKKECKLLDILLKGAESKDKDDYIVAIKKPDSYK